MSDDATRRLIRNGYSLGASTISTSVLGVVFWLVAARRYSESDVGVDASLIAAMGFLVNLSHLNLTTGFNRFLPTAGHRAKRMVLSGYAVAVGLATVAAVVFVIGAGIWTPELADVLQQPGFAIVFVVATAFSAAFVLQDFVLAGFGQARLVLIENTAYGIVKALLAVALVAVLPNRGVFGAWTIGLVLTVIPISLLLPRLMADRPQTPIEHITGREMRRYVLPDYAASLVFMGTISLLPVIILEMEGADASAYAFLAWTIAYSLYLLGRMMGISLVTEAASSPGELIVLMRAALTRCLLVVAPLAIVLAAGARYWLLPFGAEYSENGAPLLALLAIAAIPSVVTSTYLSVVRVQRRMGAVFVTMSAMSISLVALTLLLVPRTGIVGLGWAWLITQSAAAGALLVVELRTLWVRRVPIARVARASRRPRASSPRPAADLERARTIVAREHATRDFEIADQLASETTLDIVALESADRDQAVLRVANSADGEDTLRRSAEALIRLERCGAFPRSSDVVPRLLACSFETGDVWTMESRCPGVDARTVLQAGFDPATLVRAIGASTAPLYELTQRPSRPEDRLVDLLVMEPLESARQALARDRLRASSDDVRLDRIGATLTADLEARPPTVSYVHGDLWPGNVLCDAQRSAVTGLVDWDAARTSIAAVDIVQLILTTRCLTERRQLGAVVTELLRDDAWCAHERELVEGLPGGRELGPRTLVLFAWLHHVHANIRKSARYRRNPVWLAHNVHAVLDSG